MTISLLLRPLAVTGLVFAAAPILAHHSVVSVYDDSPQGRVLLEGTVKEMLGINPHSLLMVEVTNDAGEIEEWSFLTRPYTTLRRRWGFSEQTIEPGDSVRVAVSRAFDGSRKGSIRSLVLTDESRLFLFDSDEAARPEFAAMIEGARACDGLTSGDCLVVDGELVRPSSRVEIDRETPANAPVELSGLYAFNTRIPCDECEAPYTDEGRRRMEQWNVLTDDASINCGPETMPRIVSRNRPFEITQGNEEITIRYESWEVVRTIPLDTNKGRPPGAPNRPLGYSVGYWDGDTLVVETEGVTAGLISAAGQPTSDQTRTVERYRKIEGENLEVEVVVDDPINYTEPFLALHRKWQWAPDEQIFPWDCVPGIF